MKLPSITIAGTNSGCGKTTVSVGIMAALVKKGLKVQPFKVGPDFIDPMFHKYITGRESRNLDSWMLTEEVVSCLFDRSSSGADISVIEGVMGLYDGHGGISQTGSTAHVAGILNSPVILVVNGEGMSLSIVALIRGYLDYNRELDIRGVIINNIKSESHFILLKELVEEHTGLAVAGYLPKMDEINLQSRHLGLVPSGEISDLEDKINILAHQVEKTIDLELFLKIAGETGDRPGNCYGMNIERRASGLKIAVAMDKAFNFYYRDNLDLLEMLGAELLFFSPLKDEAVPGNADGLYIGGGYPEIWAENLQGNLPMRRDIKRRIAGGLPAYAECGGLMYLSESIRTKDGETYEMTGVIPGKSEMTNSLKRFGYIEIEVTNDNVMAKKGSRIRAHEFHYSTTAVCGEVPACYRISKARREKDDLTWACGYKQYNLLAGYPHVHFWSNTIFAEGFIDSCKKFSAGELR